MASEDGADPAAIAADAEHEVARRRGAGAYGDDLLRRLATPFSRNGAATAPESLAHIPSARELSGRGPLGPVKVTLQRAVRRLLAWYVHPITVDQSRFNDAITGEVRRLERRLARVETLWPPLPAHSPLNEGLDEARAAAVRSLQGGDVTGVLVVAGVDPVAALAEHEAGSLSGIYLAGVLPRLGAREMLEVVALAAARLRPGGWLAADAPDAGHPLAPRDPSGVELGTRRWLEPGTIALVAEAAGLVDARTIEVSGAEALRAWFAVVARRPT